MSESIKSWDSSHEGQLSEDRQDKQRETTREMFDQAIYQPCDVKCSVEDDMHHLGDNLLQWSRPFSKSDDLITFWNKRFNQDSEQDEEDFKSDTRPEASGEVVKELVLQEPVFLVDLEESEGTRVAYEKQKEVEQGLETGYLLVQQDDSDGMDLTCLQEGEVSRLDITIHLDSR